VARRIAQAHGIPHIELDALYWGPDWTPAPIAEFRRVVQEAAGRENWVIDGNYSRVRDIIWPRASHLVWLNLPFARVFRQALIRTAKRVVTREQLWSGNRETLQDVLFTRDSILWWVIRTHRSKAREFRRLSQDSRYQHLKIYEIRSARNLQEMLAEMEKWTELTRI
jgi:adenylate kinase family enzyme